MVKLLSNQSEKRKELLASLIRNGKIHSQADVVNELSNAGFEVTQATASRDLQDLGAMRSKGSDGVAKYVLAANSPQLPSSNLVLSVAVSGNIVVLRTPPAAAQFVASSLDAAIVAGELLSAIGTIAGDDTVLVIAAKADGGDALAEELSTTFGKGK